MKFTSFMMYELRVEKSACKWMQVAKISSKMSSTGFLDEFMKCQSRRTVTEYLPKYVCSWLCVYSWCYVSTTPEPRL